MIRHNGNETHIARPTRWQVITGAPCAGKTSVIKVLEDQGHRVVHEIARAYIDERLAAGIPLKNIKTDILGFERHILKAKVEIERHLPREQIVFMDRAVPDSIAYYQFEGLSRKEPLSYSKAVRYQHVFLFERLEFKMDRVRTEDQAMAMRIENLLVEGYESLGYEIIRVPLLSVEDRVAFVRNHLPAD